MPAVRFAPEVEGDLDDAVVWYDARQRGLGDRFLAEFRAIVGKIADIGASVRQGSGNFRHLRFRRFPYAIYFREDSGVFVVVLVISGSRDPALLERLLHERRSS